MNIIITGGHGFLGSNLARELNKRGHKITILDKKRVINNYNSGFSKKIRTKQNSWILTKDLELKALVPSDSRLGGESATFTRTLVTKK